MSSSTPNNLWAPWRMEYILGEKKGGCIFCDKPKADRDKENLILFRGRHNFIIMNRYPYNNGHLMVVPYQHSGELESIGSEASAELMMLLSRSISVLKATLGAEGFNVGMNVGKVGGAGIDAHLHFHVVPRWAADTNFMPVIGNTKVISESLSGTWDRLSQAFAEMP